MFGKILEDSITSQSLNYQKANDIAPFVEWNKPSAQFSVYMTAKPECDIAFTLETAYFGVPDNKVSQDRLVELGHCFAKAIKDYIKERAL